MIVIYMSGTAVKVLILKLVNFLIFNKVSPSYAKQLVFLFR